MALPSSVCPDCQWYSHRCQCHATLANGRVINAIQCPHCRFTTSKPAIYNHIKTCARNPYACEHTDVFIVFPRSDQRICWVTLCCRRCEQMTDLPPNLQLVCRSMWSKEVDNAS